MEGVVHWVDGLKVTDSQVMELDSLLTTSSIYFECAVMI